MTVWLVNGACAITTLGVVGASESTVQVIVPGELVLPYASIAHTLARYCAFTPVGSVTGQPELQPVVVPVVVPVLMMAATLPDESSWSTSQLNSFAVASLEKSICGVVELVVASCVIVGTAGGVV